MSYQECLHSTYFDLESWVVALVALVISLVLWKFGKRVLAIVCLCIGLLLAAFWAYGYYEFNCVELYGL